MGRKGARAGLGVVAIGFVAAASLTIVTSASATNFSSSACGGTPTNCVSLANNRYHVARWDGQVGNQIPGLDDAVLWSLANNYNPTDLSAYRDESDSLPDIWIHDFDYGQNNYIVAWVNCGSDNTGTGGAHPNRWCRGQRVRFNSYFTVGYYNTVTARRQLACHEIGHTLGLRHVSNLDSCLYTFAGDGAQPYLMPHDRNHLNAEY